MAVNVPPGPDNWNVSPAANCPPLIWSVTAPPLPAVAGETAESENCGVEAASVNETGVAVKVRA